MKTAEEAKKLTMERIPVTANAVLISIAEHIKEASENGIFKISYQSELLNDSPHVLMEVINSLRNNGYKVSDSYTQVHYMKVLSEFIISWD